MNLFTTPRRVPVIVVYNDQALSPPPQQYIPITPSIVPAIISRIIIPTVVVYNQISSLSQPPSYISMATPIIDQQQQYFRRKKHQIQILSSQVPFSSIVPENKAPQDLLVQAITSATDFPQVLGELIIEYARSPFRGKPTNFKVITDNSDLDVNDPQNKFGIIGQFKPILQLENCPNEINKKWSKDKIFHSLIINYTRHPLALNTEKRYVMLVNYYARSRNRIKKYFNKNGLHITALNGDYRGSSERSFTIWRKTKAKQLLRLMSPPNNIFPEGSFEKLEKLIEKFTD